MTDLEKRLLAQCRAYHNALDIALAMLVMADRKFFPSKSPMWPTMVAGASIMDKFRNDNDLEKT